MTAVFNGKRSPINYLNGNSKVTTTSGTYITTVPTKDGYVDIKVKTDSGNTLTALYNASTSANGVANSITAQNVSVSNWFWGQAPGTI